MSTYWLAEVGGVLHADGIPLPEVARRFGTPCFLYSAGRILTNVERFRNAFFGLPFELHYAVKANPLGAILRLLAREGLGAEVVSGGELRRALWAGFPAGRILFTGVGKTPQEHELALRCGIKAVVVESLGELHMLEDVAHELGTAAPVALRLNPALSPETHPHLATGREGSKFGLDLAATRAALEMIARAGDLHLVGLHLHLGSQIFQVEPYLAAWDFLLKVHSVAEQYGFAPEFLDLGGGFGISSVGERIFPLEELAAALTKKVPAEVTLVLEPGRALVGDAGLLLAQVLCTKEVHGRRYAVVDAGMNVLLRPALYGAHHRIVPVVPRSGPHEPMDVVGPVCENADVVARDCPLPPLASGDLIAILDAGAYGSSMASQYNSRPRPAEVLIHEGETHLIRESEPVEDLWRGEVVPPFLV